jgi:hypothetical protein
MKVHKIDDVLRRRVSQKEIDDIRRQVREEILEGNLRAVRELAGKTQEEVAEAAKITQVQVSQAERGSDHLLSTLRRYVEALGGELEVLARIGDKTVRLKGV